MQILTLNCQRGYQPGLKEFLHKMLKGGEYDFILLQEFAKEVPSYVRGAGPYDVLEIYDEQAGEMSQVCIVYRRAYKLVEKSFYAFPLTYPDPIAGTKHSTFGSLCARFHVDDTIMLVGSVHLHSGIDHKARAAQMQKIKEQVLSLVNPADAVVFGGDCNFGFPGERARAERIVAPQFVCATRSLGPTLDSRYAEHAPHLPNRISAFFALFGIKIPLWTDQIFVDANTAEQNKTTCRILPDRVSDHSPVELVF